MNNARRVSAAEDLSMTEIDDNPPLPVSPRHNNVASLRTKELFRLFRNRGAVLQPDEAGRDGLLMLLSTIAAIGGDQSDRIAAAFDLAPWMSADEREATMRIAATSSASWSADDIAQRQGVTMEERLALRLGTIGAIDCDRVARQERRAQKHRERQRERRRRKRLQPKQRPVEGRAAAVLETIPRVMAVPVKWITERVADHPAFQGISKASLPRSVRDAVEHLKTAEAIRTEMRGLKGVAQIMWVARLPRDAAEYRRHFARKLASFDRSSNRRAIPAWFNSERRLRERLGLDESEFENAARAHRDKLFGAPGSIVREPELARKSEAT
jgi:hypothetical protein